MTYMRQKTERFYLITVFLLPVLLSVQSCTCRFETMSALESVSSYISEEPDRALSDLDSIHASGIKGREANAKYALLYSIALEKNWIEDTDDSLVNISVEWYSRHGSADDKLKAYLSGPYLPECRRQRVRDGKFRESGAVCG